jgi:hypothetical protein
MKLEIVEHCFGQYVRVNGVDVCDMDNVYPKEELFEKRMLLIKELTDSNLFVHPSIWIDIANSLSGLDSFEYNDEESSSDVCDQCGNWNSTNVYDKKQIIDKEQQKQHLIDMMKADEELGLYDEPKQVLTEEDIWSKEDIDAVTDYINKETLSTKLHKGEVVDESYPKEFKQETLEEESTIIRFPPYYESKQEIKLEEVFNDEKKENIKKFIDEIKNPSQPNQALKDAAQRYEKYSERFDNKDNEIVEGIFNPDNWGRRLVKEKPKQETLEEVAERLHPDNGFEDDLYCDEGKIFRESWLAGAKWQQERMYSEEEVIAFGEFIFKHTLLAHSKGVKNLFEQFKKK